jgi:anti-anti-sigma factor
VGRFLAERNATYAMIDIQHDVDIASAGEFEAVLAALRAPGTRPRPLIVDFSSCSFIDCAGLTVLMRYHRDHENFIIVVPPEHAMRRIFAVTELDRVLPLIASRDEAIAQARSVQRA